jgi:glycosyltransferase involved in cell wall biosynthesis
MKIIFISNYFTHHQKPLSEAFNRLTAGKYLFLATCKMSEDRKSQGWGIDMPAYVENVDLKSEQSVNHYITLINDADVVIQGDLCDKLIEQRVKSNKLTFIYNERLYKSFRRYLKIPLYLYKGLKYRNCYVLAASAFTPLDYAVTRSYMNRCYKYGYFPVVKKYDDVNRLIASGRGDDELKHQRSVSILWVARLIEWKHPEAPIEVAKRLKAEGYSFTLGMIGVGVLKQKIEQMIADNNLSDCVSLLGAMKPDEVRSYMERSDIYLFTSDQNEGWGAVLNEAMNSACAVVANDQIGSVPYLIKDGANGLVYSKGNIDHLYRRVKELIDNPERRESIAINAYKTMADTWNADVAAERLITLANDLIQGRETSFDEGPCSEAEIIHKNWFTCR